MLLRKPKALQTHTSVSSHGLHVSGGGTQRHRNEVSLQNHMHGGFHTTTFGAHPGSIDAKVWFFWMMWTVFRTQVHTHKPYQSLFDKTVCLCVLSLTFLTCVTDALQAERWYISFLLALKRNLLWWSWEHLLYIRGRSAVMCDALKTKIQKTKI